MEPGILPVIHFKMACLLKNFSQPNDSSVPGTEETIKQRFSKHVITGSLAAQRKHAFVFLLFLQLLPLSKGTFHTSKTMIFIII